MHPLFDRRRSAKNGARVLHRILARKTKKRFVGEGETLYLCTPLLKKQLFFNRLEARRLEKKKRLLKPLKFENKFWPRM